MKSAGMADAIHSLLVGAAQMAKVVMKSWRNVCGTNVLGSVVRAVRVATFVAVASGGGVFTSLSVAEIPIALVRRYVAVVAA
jgi:hypothetical protein